MDNSVQASQSDNAVPDERAFDVEKISLLQVEIDGDGDVNGFVGCDVEVHTIDGAVKATGELTNYDQLNGSVTIKTLSGANVIAHVRETFVI